jgi:hypothetical protein
MIQIDIGWTIHGWEEAVRGMRNPMNSWALSDSRVSEFTNDGKGGFVFGDNDLKLASKLAVAGSDHAKFRRMITVYADITAPLYWWKEFDTYKVGTVANSCSTMHKIGEKEFEASDFSIEHLGVRDYDDEGNECYRNLWISEFPKFIEYLNIARRFYLKETRPDVKKQYWWQMIQFLPSSYNQRRTVMMNYEVLSNMYHARKNHKLDEWLDFCKWIRDLPYADELIIGKKE